MRGFLSLLGLMLLSVNTMALPINSLGRKGALFPQSFTGSYNFEGIVGLSNCSGSLVRFTNSNGGDMAMVMTNGHCLELGFPAPGQVYYGQPSSRRFSLLNSNGSSVGQVQATQVMYSTMTGTDLTMYKLGVSYDAILSKFGIHALTLSPAHPSAQDPIEVISGYWKKGFTCGVDAFVRELQEEGYVWVDSIRYSRPGCETYGGTSGSPILLKGSRVVIGINNTGNEDGRQCTMNNPCEVDANGRKIAVKGYSYGQQSYWIYSCLNSSNEIDLQKTGCQLYH